MDPNTVRKSTGNTAPGGLAALAEGLCDIPKTAAQVSTEHGAAEEVEASKELVAAKEKVPVAGQMMVAGQEEELAPTAGKTQVSVVTPCEGWYTADRPLKAFSFFYQNTSSR